MKSRGGSTLVAALLISVVLLLAGMGFLGQRAAQNRAVNGALLNAQARALAESGIEDALQKLSKDNRFPPLNADSQTVFTYQETALDAGGNPLGESQVTVDVTYRQAPYSIIKLTSIGRVGPPGGPWQATAQLESELDVAPKVRGAATVNPNFFKLLYLRSGQSF